MRSILRVIIAGIALLAGVWAGEAASPIYVNNSPVVSPPDIAPQIDATAFVNRSLFSISGQVLPYETYNTVAFTNSTSGRMFGNPGFRFQYASDAGQEMMHDWVNQGTIGTDSSFFFLSGASANWLLVASTNITSTGPLSVGSQGVLQLVAKTNILRRTGLRAGAAQTNAGFFFGSSVLSTGYFNDVGVTDIHWGAGTNNVLRGASQLMDLTGSGGLNSLFYTLPFPQSPLHEVVEIFSNFFFTNTTFVPFFQSFGELYGAAVFTNRSSTTNLSIQVVFYPTNSFDTNYTRDVRFFPGFGGGGATVVVGFNSIDFDIVSQTYLTNSVYLVDALAFQTNVVLARNFDVNTRRPHTYDVTRNQPFFFSFGATNGNAEYTNSMIYNPTYLSNRVRVLYAGYQAQISPFNSPGFTTPGVVLGDPTNFPGRVEIFGDEVDLDQTRIRADSTMILRAARLTSNRVAQVDAPFVIFDVGTIQPLLVVSNIAPDTVRRLSGTISAWSGIWRNVETNALATNTIDFHVLIVEDNLVSQQSVLVNEFRVRGTNVIVADLINVGSIMQLNMTSLEFTKTGSLRLPAGSSWGATNVLNVRNLTNDGLIFINGQGNFGQDRAQPYDDIINRGTLSAATHLIRARNFDNSGSVIANGGLLSVEALSAKLLGQPTVIVTNVFTNIFFGFTNVITNLVTNSLGARLAGNGDIQLFISDLLVSNSVLDAGLDAPGGLIVSVTNTLQDRGPEALNKWQTDAGVQMIRKPVMSDLLGTEIDSVAPPFLESLHVWAGDNRGATVDGFVNNLALGRLILDARNPSSALRFRGSGSNKALYVDFIQFENFATNFTQAVVVEPSLTIYFADSNLSAEKLDGALGGRFRWVPYYAGHFSSTNITYSSGQTFRINRALASSKDRDDNNNGVVNSEDPEPILFPSITLVVTNSPSMQAILSWESVAFHTNRVQFKTSLTVVVWQDLTSVVNGAINTRLRVTNAIPASTRQRFYRVRVDPP